MYKVTRVMMEILKLLLSINLILIVIKTVTGNNLSVEFFNRQFESIKLIRYDINLIIYMNENDYKNTDIYETFKLYIDEQQAKGNFIFYGESTIFFEDIRQYHVIRLNILNLDIDDMRISIVFTLNGTDYWIAPDKHIYHSKTQTIDIHFNQNSLLDFSTYRLFIKFVGSTTDNTGGLVKTSYINDEKEKTWLISTGDFQETGARQIFPCWYQPYARSNFTISIKHYQNYTVLSNTPIDKKSADENGMVWTHFRTTNKISPYHIAVVLTDLDHIFDTNWWCRQQVKTEITFAQTIVHNVVTYLGHIIKNINFLSEVNHVVIPDFRDEGLERSGLILYRESAIIYNEEKDSIKWKFEVMITITRKILHQLFGNVADQTWSSLWLNEGIVKFWTMSIISEFVRENLMNVLTIQHQQECLRINDYYDMPLISGVNTSSDISFTFTYYVKAPVFVRSLLQAIPVESQMTSNYIEKCLIQYLNVNQKFSQESDTSINIIDKFFNILQETLYKRSKLNIDFKMKFGNWTKQKRYPVLQMIRYSSGIIMISLLQKYSYETDPINSWIYVTCTTQNNSHIMKKGWLSPYRSALFLKNVHKNHWIIVNVQQAGYYRVNYDKDNWQKLAHYLNSMEYVNIHVLNRAQIIDDAYYFLSRNELNFNLFKTLTYYLSNETDYVAWYPMFKILEQMSSFFPFSQSTEVKEHFRNILDLVLKKIGLPFGRKKEFEKDVFHICLREEVTKWACIFKSWWCTRDAFFKSRRFQEMSFLPEWKEWSYCNEVLLLENSTFWREMLNTVSLNFKLSQYSECLKNYTVIIAYIDRMGHYEIQNRITIFHSIVAQHVKNNFILDYILRKFKSIIPREISKIVAFVDIINHLHSKEQLNKVENFIKNNLFPDDYLKIHKKITIRELEIQKHIDYFESFLKM